MTLSMDKLPDPKGKKPEDVISRQDLFLESYKSRGSVRSAVKGINIGRTQVYSWLSSDTHGFRERFEFAKHDFRDMLEDIALDRVVEQKVSDNPTLLIALLNANLPEKYRPQSIQTDETAKEVIKELRNATRLIADESEIIEVEESTDNKLEKILKSKKK